MATLEIKGHDKLYRDLYVDIAGTTRCFSLEDEYTSEVTSLQAAVLDKIGAGEFTITVDEDGAVSFALHMSLTPKEEISEPEIEDIVEIEAAIVRKFHVWITRKRDESYVHGCTVSAWKYAGYEYNEECARSRIECNRQFHGDVTAAHIVIGESAYDDIVAEFKF